MKAGAPSSAANTSTRSGTPESPSTQRSARSMLDRGEARHHPDPRRAAAGHPLGRQPVDVVVAHPAEQPFGQHRRQQVGGAGSRIAGSRLTVASARS